MELLRYVLNFFTLLARVKIMYRHSIAHSTQHAAQVVSSTIKETTRKMNKYYNQKNHISLKLSPQKRKIYSNNPSKRED